MSFSSDFLYAVAALGSIFLALKCVWSLLWGEIPFSAGARRKHAEKSVLTAARTFILSYEDLPDYADGGAYGAQLADLRAAWTRRDADACQECLAKLDPPKSWAAGREWLDILVVSISVAMAFRAYYYEPFNIPTGSMQPTLYGNHSETCSPAQATFWDKGPQKWYKWAFTGRMYECFKAPFNGQLAFAPTKTGHYDMRVIGTDGKPSKSMLVPTDVLHPSETGDGPYRTRTFRLPNGLTPGSLVRAGQLLWSGYVVTGDFLFVNRWLWNFRAPARGDVMIFSTTGISGLDQGTHYIKRMTGTPGETLSFVAKEGPRAEGTPVHYNLCVNGEIPRSPRRIAQIQDHLAWHEKAYPYAGYQPSETENYNNPGRTLCHATDKVTLGPAEYYACGDNSPSSYDSRYWGPVPASNLRGIAGGVFWPFSHRWGPIE